MAAKKMLHQTRWGVIMDDMVNTFHCVGSRRWYHQSVEPIPNAMTGNASAVCWYQNILLFFFFIFSPIVSLCVLNPQKLFLAFARICGFANPVLKKLL